MHRHINNVLSLFNLNVIFEYLTIIRYTPALIYHILSNLDIYVPQYCPYSRKYVMSHLILCLYILYMFKKKSVLDNAKHIKLK